MRSGSTTILFACVCAAHLSHAQPKPSLTVVMLGTGTPNPDENRSGPATAIIAGSQAYLVDAGPGVVRRAWAAANQTGIEALRAPRLTFLFITHLHSDHTVGYPDLIFTGGVAERKDPLEVFGPAGTRDMTDHLMAAWKKDLEVRIHGPEQESPGSYQIHVHEIHPGVVHKDANITVKAFAVHHTTWDEAFAYRFETPDRSVVISGDASPSPGILEACNACDVLVHEVYCGKGSAYYHTSHTSSAELAQIATKAKPKLLVLYHQLMHGCNEAELLQEVRQGYSGAVVSAKDFEIF